MNALQGLVEICSFTFCRVYRQIRKTVTSSRSGPETFNDDAGEEDEWQPSLVHRIIEFLERTFLLVCWAYRQEELHEHVPEYRYWMEEGKLVLLDAFTLLRLTRRQRRVFSGDEDFVR